MNIVSTLEQIKAALTGIDGLVVGHYEADPKDGQPYCVWQEDAEATSLNADDYKYIQQLQGTIDLFTQNDPEPFVDDIQDALTNARIGWRLNSVQYEDETKYVHWEWVFYIV